MKMREKQSLTAQVTKRYLKARKAQKSQMLDEFVENTGYNRSYARRAIRQAAKKDFRRRKKIIRVREKIYDVKLLPHLVKLWRMGNCICGKRLAPILPEYIFALERDQILEFPPDIKEKLLKISAASIDRLLTKEKRRFRLKGRSLTKPGTLLKHQIPIRTFSQWNHDLAGFFEMDTVSFGGSDPRGHYVWGLDMTDVATGWVLLDAVMGRGQYGIHQAVDEGKKRLIFPLQGLDCDSGGEFINQIMFRYCQENKITFTRNRPGRKNDNCYVEQKNYTTLRTFLGYGRYETEEQLKLIRQILSLVEIYINFFQPSAKLMSKQRSGARVSKKYDVATTPYKRLCHSGILSKKQRQILYQVYRSHNPMELMKKITKLQEKLWHSTVTKLNEATNPVPLHF